MAAPARDGLRWRLPLLEVRRQEAARRLSALPALDGKSGTPESGSMLFWSDDITHANDKGKTMKRIYFLVPNIEIARKVVDELLLARVEERHIHVLAKRGTSLEDLPEATFLQKSDFIPALEQGLALGGLTGILAGVVAVALPTGLVLGGGALLAIALAGSGVGALMSSMVGISIGDRRIQQFQEAIENGELLMMVDVPRRRVEEIEQIVKSHHPEAECEGTEPTIPPFP